MYIPASAVLNSVAFLPNSLQKGPPREPHQSWNCYTMAGYWHARQNKQDLAIFGVIEFYVHVKTLAEWEKLGKNLHEPTYEDILNLHYNNRNWGNYGDNVTRLTPLVKVGYAEPSLNNQNLYHGYWKLLDVTALQTMLKTPLTLPANTDGWYVSKARMKNVAP